jgi:hypothetical protein
MAKLKTTKIKYTCVCVCVYAPNSDYLFQRIKVHLRNKQLVCNVVVTVRLLLFGEQPAAQKYIALPGGYGRSSDTIP